MSLMTWLQPQGQQEAGPRPPTPSSNLPQSPTHRDDVILAEAQLVVIVPLKVQQGLGPAPLATRAGHIVLVVPLVTLHAVVWGQLLPGW